MFGIEMLHLQVDPHQTCPIGLCYLKKYSKCRKYLKASITSLCLGNFFFNTALLPILCKLPFQLVLQYCPYLNFCIIILAIIFATVPC